MGLVSCLVLAVLACSGFLWMFTQQLQKTPPPVTVQIDRPPEPKQPLVVEKPKEEPKVSKVEIVMPDLDKLLNPFKDLDDAVAKLDPKYPTLIRIGALNYIASKDLPADAAKKKAIMDAVIALQNDKDERVREMAKNLKFVWDSGL